ncbi:MAG TPA: hypothetical protein VGG72_26025 [Bryobacteraceae bacterium]|jgi:hypothetical protein
MEYSCVEARVLFANANDLFLEESRDLQSAAACLALSSHDRTVVDFIPKVIERYRTRTRCAPASGAIMWNREPADSDPRVQITFFSDRGIREGRNFAVEAY